MIRTLVKSLTNSFSNSSTNWPKPRDIRKFAVVSLALPGQLELFNLTKAIFDEQTGFEIFADGTIGPGKLDSRPWHSIRGPMDIDGNRLLKDVCWGEDVSKLDVGKVVELNDDERTFSFETVVIHAVVWSITSNSKDLTSSAVASSKGVWSGKKHSLLWGIVVWNKSKIIQLLTKQIQRTMSHTK